MKNRLYVNFSDFFNVSPQLLEDYGAFNISLINDLPLFIDPFLLFQSENRDYRKLHDDIIEYVKFLRDVSIKEGLSQEEIKLWFCFPEVKQNWLGYSRRGNGGSGLGSKFALNLSSNLSKIYKDFGNECVSKSSHLEKLCLFGEGAVGRDHLSDFVTNLIKGYLLDYTEKFTIENIDKSFCKTIEVDKVEFDYLTKRWKSKSFTLPFLNNDYVLLTPKNILTKDAAWINQSDLFNQFEQICPSIPNEELREKIDSYFKSKLKEKRNNNKFKDAIISTIKEFPIVVDYFIKYKEENGALAQEISRNKVKHTEEQFVIQLKKFVEKFLINSEFYGFSFSYEESLKKIQYLKDIIENRDGEKLLYVSNKPIQYESDLQLIFRLTLFHKISLNSGELKKEILQKRPQNIPIEFKLASNKKLNIYLKKKCKTNDNPSIFVICYFSDHEFENIHKILKDLGLSQHKNIILIDGSQNYGISSINKVDLIRNWMSVSKALKKLENTDLLSPSNLINI